jgi:hypothetical protein
MIVGSFVMAYFCLALSGWAAWVGRRVWRRVGTPPSARLRASMVFSERSSEAFDRTLYALALVMFFSAGLLVSFGAANEADPSGSSSSSRGGGAWSVLAAIAHMLAIAWFNRPRFLVPGHLRRQEGMLVAWYAARRSS